MNVFPQMNPDEPTAPPAPRLQPCVRPWRKGPRSQGQTPGPCEPLRREHVVCCVTVRSSAARSNTRLQVHSQGAAYTPDTNATHPACPQHLNHPLAEIPGLINTHFQCSAPLISCHHKESHNETCHMPTTRLQGERPPILSMDEDVKQTLNSCEVLLKSFKRAATLENLFGSFY